MVDNKVLAIVLVGLARWRGADLRAQPVPLGAERLEVDLDDRGVQLGDPIREGNLIGNGPQVLQDIDLLGNDFAMGDPGTCGKDGQGVPVGDGQPTLRVRALTVGGTAA